MMLVDLRLPLSPMPLKAFAIAVLALLTVSQRALAAEPILYGLIQTSGFNEVATYDLNDTGGFGYDAHSITPLNLTNLLPQNSISSIAVQGDNLYGLIRTSGFNELITYDLTQTGGFGYDAHSITPLNLTNLLPQNSISSIAVQGTTLYGLITTSGFNELITYDLTQAGGFGYDAQSITPLNLTNLLPQNSISSIAVVGTTLYSLITTSGFNELITYDLTQTGGFGYDAQSITPLNITNLLPQNSISSIAVQGDNLYGLIRTSGFNELITYDLTQSGGFGYGAQSLTPLNITNLLPQNSIIGIALSSSDGGGGPGGSVAVPEPSTWAMMVVGFFGLGLVRRGGWCAGIAGDDCGSWPLIGGERGRAVVRGL